MTWIIRIATALVVLIIITIFLAPSLISKETVRKKLIAQIEQTTGRQLEIGGAINVQFLPFPKVEATDVSLSGPEGFNEEAFILIKALEVNVALLPLLKKEIVITKLHLNNADVKLEVNPNGENNWTFTPKSKNAKKAASTVESSGHRSSPPNIVFGDVHLTGSSVTYLDRRNSKKHELKQVNLSLEAQNIYDPVSLKGDALYHDKKMTLTSNLGSLYDLFENKSTDFGLTIANELIDINYKGRIEAMAFKGKLAVKSQSLTSVMSWLQSGKNYSENAQPLALDLTSDVDCTLDSCFFKKLSATLDAVKVSGEASFNLASRKPQINLDLFADALDLNPFLPKETSPQAFDLSLVSSAHAAESKSWSKETIDLYVLNEFDATINIKTGSLLVQKLRIGETTLRSKVQNGRLSADIIDAVFYGGKATITANVDSRSMTVDKRLELSGVQAEPFMRDALGEERLSGTLNTKAAFVTRGRSESEMIANLQGKGEMRFIDGAIRGINLADMVRNIQSAFKQVNASPQKTDFAELGGTFTIANGVLKNNDLAMKAPLIRLSGEGQINLPQRTINYRLRPEFVDTMQGQGGKDKSGIVVPVIVEGRLDNPSFRPDLASAAQEALKDPQKIKDTVKNVKEQLKGDGLKDAVKDVKGILKGF